MTQALMAASKVLGIVDARLWYAILVLLVIVLIVMYVKYRKEMKNL